MKQVLQNRKTKQLELCEVPRPTVRRGQVLIRTAASVISAGTEKSAIDGARKSLVSTASSRPDLVKKVLTTLSRDGLAATVEAVTSKLSERLQLGYSAAGVVVEVGPEVVGLQAGDRVAMAGAGYASHAEYNCVPKNLVSKIPEGVGFEEAAYTTLSSIAMQGLRLCRPALGDKVAVVGLGLVGLLTIQLLKANGCRVIGIDLDPFKADLALKAGADVAVTENPGEAALQFSEHRGVDHVIIAAATPKNGPIELAGEITRRKGNVVVVGAVGMEVPRGPYYAKEIKLQISMSYGPGRYDPSYEEGGVDYPYEYVRWTERRNMEACLDLMAAGSLRPREITTHTYPLAEAARAYDLIHKPTEPYVGIVLEYPQDEAPVATDKVISLKGASAPADHLKVGFIGAGAYASIHLLPHLRKNKRVSLTGVACATPVSARQKGERFGFQYCTTQTSELLAKNDDLVFIATRHDTHASLVTEALEQGHHVFVEKPLATNRSELETVQKAYLKACAGKPRLLMVGHNRRFSPMVTRLAETFSGPLQMLYRVNPGCIPDDHWTQSSENGGGMLVSEMCHFIDVMRYLARSRPTHVTARALGLEASLLNPKDNVSITVAFENGSLGTLFYTTSGARELAKERLEVFGAGQAAVLDDYKSLELFGPRAEKMKSSSPNKGQAIQVQKTLECLLEGKGAPIPFTEIVDVMKVIFGALDSMEQGATIALAETVGVG